MLGSLLLLPIFFYLLYPLLLDVFPPGPVTGGFSSPDSDILLYPLLREVFSSGPVNRRVLFSLPPMISFLRCFSMFFIGLYMAGSLLLLLISPLSLLLEVFLRALCICGFLLLSSSPYSFFFLLFLIHFS
jgi:hypothetical protein